MRMMNENILSNGEYLLPTLFIVYGKRTIQVSNPKKNPPTESNVIL